MKKIMGVLAIMMFVITSFAQKFDKVKNEILINQFELAKVDFDKILQKNPTLVGTPEAIFWEAKILTGYLKDSALSKKYANSFENMQNNLEKLLSSESGNSFLNEKYKDPEYSISDPFIQVYTKIRNDGVEKYNQKKFNDAANLFKICVKYSDVFYGRGWIDPKIKSDSLTILFTAICYKEDKNYKDAIPYLERLINEKSMTRLEGIFGDLIDCLIESKDKENLNKYIDLAKKEYPFYVEDWNQRSFKFISKYYTNEEKVKLYDDVTAKSTLTESEYQLYGDMFTTAKMENPTEEIFFEKANDAYVKMFNLNKKNTAAAINIGINYYNKFNELDEKYTANIKSLQKLNAGKAEATPKNIKDKANFEKTFKAQVDSIKNLNVNVEAKKKINADASIEWNTVAFDLLKDKVDLERIDKNILGKAVRMLTVLYDYKKSKEQGKDQKALLDFEEKYKKFDALMDKYQ